MALYLIIQIGAALSRIIPRPWRYLIGTIVGDCVFLVWRSKRRVMLENMATVTGLSRSDPRVRRLAVKSMRNYCKYLVEFLELPTLSSSDHIISSMKIQGLDHLQAGLAVGKGVILASAHFGTIEVGGLRLADFTDFHAVYDTFQPDYLDELIQRKRKDKGINLVAVNNVREMLRVLRHGGTLTLLYDRPMDVAKGVPVRFFGRDTAVPAGPAVLAMKTGATLLPVYMFRQPDSSFQCLIFPPIAWSASGDKDRDVQCIMQKLMDTLQTVVRERPDQWYMFRPMWPEDTGHGTPRQTRGNLRQSASRVTRNHALYAALRLASRVTPVLPLRLVYGIAAAVGTLAYATFSGPRSAISANLSRVMRLPPSAPQVRRAALRAFQNDARNWVDTLRISRVSSQQIISSVDVEGWHFLEAAVGQGKGVVLVGLHLGNFDLVGQALAARGYKVTIPVEVMQPPKLFDFLVSLRTSKGINVIPIARAPREMVRAVQRGEIVAITGDRNISGRGEHITFFGAQTELPRGPISLARHTGAPIVVACGVRTEPGRYQGFITPPLTMVDTKNARLDDTVNMRRLAATMEKFIEGFPDQWLVFSPVWLDDGGGKRPATMGHQKGAAV